MPDGLLWRARTDPRTLRRSDHFAGRPRKANGKRPLSFVEHVGLMRIGWILALLLLAPLATAHGAPQPREIDVRLLEDTTSSGDYGGPEGALDGGGLDLLALDVYEGTLPGTAEAALVFRVIVQGGDAGAHRLDVKATAGGQDHVLDLTTSDLATYDSAAFDAVRGPFDVGDGHPKAIEGIVRHAALGIAPGDAVTQIRVESHFGGDIQDKMPGSWYTMGQEVPLPPPEEAGDPAAYTTQGPLEAFTLAANMSLVPVREGTAVGLVFNSSLPGTDQAITLSASAPAGINVSFSDTTVLLDAGQSAMATMDVSGVALGTVRILAQSDLGVAVLISLPLDGAGQVGTGVDVESDNLAPGDSFQYTFLEPGTFEYHCHPHPWMTAKITIAAPVNGTAPQTHVVKLVEPSSKQSEWGFEPETLTIHAGDTVVWVNDGTVVHNIMGTTGGHGHDGHDHDHGPPAGKDSPAPLLLVPLVVALAVLRRRP